MSFPELCQDSISLLLTPLHACSGITQPASPGRRGAASLSFYARQERERCPQAGPGSPQRERCPRLRFPGRSRAAQRAPSVAGSAAGGKRRRRRQHGRAETARAPLLREPSLPPSLPARPPRPAASPAPARPGAPRQDQHRPCRGTAEQRRRRERPHTNLRARAPLRRSRDRESAPRSPAAPAARPPLTRAPLPGRRGEGATARPRPAAGARASVRAGGAGIALSPSPFLSSLLRAANKN